MVDKVFVYSGDGAGQRSVTTALTTLNQSLAEVAVKRLSTKELIRGDWRRQCLLLCMPGGADLPYCRDLNGSGNSIIKDYVTAGGAYLGLCAGAYYACSKIEFETGTALEVKGDRELAFFPGLAKGAVYPGFTYQSEAGAVAAPLQYKDREAASGWCSCCDYSNGGPEFIADEHSTERLKELAHYTALPRVKQSGVAAVKCQVGKGVAVLCGTHPELDARDLEAALSIAQITEAHPECSSAEVKQLVSHTASVAKVLERYRQQRKLFWELLLLEAGLGQHMHYKPSS